MFQHDTISNILMRYNFFDTKYYLCILSWSIRSPMPHLRWPPNPSGIPSLILFPESVPVNGSGTLFWKIKDQGTMRAEKNFLICECPKSLEFKTILPEVVLPFEHLLQHHIDVYHYSVESSFEFFRLWLDWPYHLQMHLDYLNTMMNLCLNLES